MESEEKKREGTLRFVYITVQLYTNRLHSVSLLCRVRYYSKNDHADESVSGLIGIGVCTCSSNDLLCSHRCSCSRIV